MRLTPHFNLEEFGSKIPVRFQNGLYLLCLFLLEPVRMKWGPVKITSGYRTTVENHRVGGSPRSQHLKGEAVDFICTKALDGMGLDGMGEVYYWIVNVLAFPGEVLWYRNKGYIHGALPRLGITSDHLIKET